MRFWIVVVLLCLAPAVRAAPEFPALTGRVVDGAGVLSEATRQELTARLAGHEAKTGNQVAVVTLPTLQGYTIEEFGYQLGRHWGIGSSEKNNGVLLIVAPKERKLRIEVGYGLEGQLTDALTKTIIEQRIVPHFRSGDFNAGVRDGVSAILAVLGDVSEGEAGPRRDRADEGPPGWAWGPGIIFFLWAVFMYAGMLRYRRREGQQPWERDSRHGGFGGGFRGGRGGGFRGGGFSGGGGGFGGGGASGGW
jgi:uncharacterized protein